QEEGAFDFVLMDCAPSLGVLTLNALAAANEVFIPLQPHFLALHGLGKLFETTALVGKRINPAVRVTGIVICLYDAGTRLSEELGETPSVFAARVAVDDEGRARVLESQETAVPIPTAPRE